MREDIKRTNPDRTPAFINGAVAGRLSQLAVYATWISTGYGQPNYERDQRSIDMYRNAASKLNDGRSPEYMAAREEFDLSRKRAKEAAELYIPPAEHRDFVNRATNNRGLSASMTYPRKHWTESISNELFGVPLIAGGMLLIGVTIWMASRLRAREMEKTNPYGVIEVGSMREGLAMETARRAMRGFPRISVTIAISMILAGLIYLNAARFGD